MFSNEVVLNLIGKRVPNSFLFWGGGIKPQQLLFCLEVVLITEPGAPPLKQNSVILTPLHHSSLTSLLLTCHLLLQLSSLSQMLLCLFAHFTQVKLS